MSANAATPSGSDSDFSTLAILLLKGVVYRHASEPLWRALLGLRGRVRDYVAVLGLDLVLDEDEGYALLRPRGGAASGKPSELPEVIASHALSFPAALLLARLRQALAELDARGEGTRLVLTRSELDALLGPFVPRSPEPDGKPCDATAHVDRLVELGLLRRLDAHGGTAAYEVQRVLRAIIDPTWLSALEQRVARASDRGSGTAPAGEASR
jgi:hypothetical protein